MTNSVNDEIVNYETICDYLCLDPRASRVQQLVKSGVLPKVGKDQYPLKECVKSYIQFLRNPSKFVEGVGYSEARTKVTSVQAEIKSIQLQRLKNELVPVAQVIEVWGNLVSNMRAKMRSIPDKIAPRVRATKTNAEAKTLIKKQIDQALSELAETDIEYTGTQLPV